MTPTDARKLAEEAQCIHETVHARTFGKCNAVACKLARAVLDLSESKLWSDTWNGIGIAILRDENQRLRTELEWHRDNDEEAEAEHAREALERK